MKERLKSCPAYNNDKVLAIDILYEDVLGSTYNQQ